MIQLNMFATHYFCINRNSSNQKRFYRTKLKTIVPCWWKGGKFQKVSHRYLFLNLWHPFAINFIHFSVKNSAKNSMTSLEKQSSPKVSHIFLFEKKILCYWFFLNFSQYDRIQESQNSAILVFPIYFLYMDKRFILQHLFHRFTLIDF